MSQEKRKKRLQHKAYKKKTGQGFKVPKVVNPTQFARIMHISESSENDTDKTRKGSSDANNSEKSKIESSNSSPGESTTTQQRNRLSTRSAAAHSSKGSS
eukprot:122836_1